MRKTRLVIVCIAIRARDEAHRGKHVDSDISDLLAKSCLWHAKPNTLRLDRFEKSPLSRRDKIKSRVPYLTDLKRREYGSHTSDMVSMGMACDEDVDPLDPEGMQIASDCRPLLRDSGVHEHVLADRELDEDRISLSNVDHAHGQIGRKGRSRCGDKQQGG